MSGLFTRLAQQSLNQRKPSLEPVRSPVFPAENTESLEHIDDHHQDSAQVSAASEVSPALAQHGQQRAEDTNDETRRDSLALASSPPLFATPHVIPVLTARKEHTMGNTLSESTQDQEVVVDREILEAPVIQPQIQTQSATVIEHRNPQEPRMESANQKERQLPIQHPTSLQPQSLATPTHEKMFAMDRARDNRTHVSGMNRNSSDSQPTIINVSIGQIDIKATSTETPTLKKSRQSNRNPLVSLDDYQLKRQRGE